MPDALRSWLTLALLLTLAVPARASARRCRVTVPPPSGRCRLRAWHPDVAARVLGVDVPAAGDVALDVSL